MFLVKFIKCIAIGDDCVISNSRLLLVEITQSFLSSVVEQWKPVNFTSVIN